MWLLVLGVFSSIYHPVGSAMLVTHARQLGRELGINGVWGNLGAASASGITALLAAAFGWRASFILPGLVFIVAGAAFLWLVSGDGDRSDATQKAGPATVRVAGPLLLASVFALALAAGGMTFNMATISLPKVIDERLGIELPLALVGSLATAVFAFGALTQLLAGRLVDRVRCHGFRGPGSAPAARFRARGFVVWAVNAGGLGAGDGGDLRPSRRQRRDGGALCSGCVPGEGIRRAYFLGFATGGLAVPLIGLLHGSGGSSWSVLAVAGLFGAAVFAGAVVFQFATRSGSSSALAPAE